jgi:hypothetical protein
MSIKSFIQSLFTRAKFVQASSRVTTGSAASATPQPSTRPAKKGNQVVAVLKDVVLLPSSPASSVLRRSCPATRKWTARLRDECTLHEGHDGPHLVNDPLLMGCTPAQTFLDHGIVHRVEWFEFDTTTRKRAILTACNRVFETHNRTKHHKRVTCLGCSVR